jgi:TatD DNase family protein
MESNMNYHDTHFHLDLSDSPRSVADQIENLGIYTIAVTNSPSVFHFTNELSTGKKYLRAALGLHPELAYERSYELGKFIELSILTRYIGEVGLDNLRKSSEDYRSQKKVFETIIDTCAVQKGKILTIHSRKSESDVIDLIGNNFPGKIILHWYSGSIGNLEKAVEYGYYFSINYNMTQSESGKRIINRIPIERILIESDGPFTSYRSEKCTPMVAKQIVNEIAQLKQGQTEVDTPEIISANFQTLLSK